MFYAQILLRNIMDVMNMRDYPTFHLEMKYMSITVIVVLHFTVTVQSLTMRIARTYVLFLEVLFEEINLRHDISEILIKLVLNTNQLINQHYTIINEAKKQSKLTGYTPSFSSRTRTSQYGCYCYISLLCSHYNFFETIFILSACVSKGEDC